ncbi:MAG: hypothetical protein FWH28_06435 [Clostridiales bacterium]|nr:hypothetical protein [Clostridiales bacterium]
MADTNASNPEQVNTREPGDSTEMGVIVGATGTESATVGESGSRYYMKMKYQEKQFLRAADFIDEQEYHVQKMMDHNRHLHVHGISDGLEVEKSVYEGCVTVSPGSAIDIKGRQMKLELQETIDLATACVSSTGVYHSPVQLFIRYGQANATEARYKQEEGVFSGTTRWVEKPEFYIRPVWEISNAEDHDSPATDQAVNVDGDLLLLARIERNADGKIPDGGVNTNPWGRRTATVKMALELQEGMIQNEHLAAGAVTAEKINDGAVAEGKIGADAVATGNMKNLAVTEAKLGANAVTTSKIQNLAVTEAKIGANAITTGKINDRAVSGQKIALKTITKDNLTTSTLSSYQLGLASVNNGALQSRAVTEYKIADGAVAGRKIASYAVTTNKIASKAVAFSKMNYITLDHGEFTVPTTVSSAQSATSYTFYSPPRSVTRDQIIPASLINHPSGTIIYTAPSSTPVRNTSAYTLNLDSICWHESLLWQNATTLIRRITIYFTGRNSSGYSVRVIQWYLA